MMVGRGCTRRMQTLLEGTGQTMSGFPRRLLMASRGALSMTREEAEQLLERGEDLFDRLVERGQKLEDGQRSEWLRDWERRGREQFQEVEEQVEQQVQNVLQTLHIPSAEDIERLNREIERISARLDAHLAASQAKALPIEGYQDLTVTEVLPLLEGLDEAGLKAIQAFEQANANRVTVLRAIDEKLAMRS